MHIVRTKELEKLIEQYTLEEHQRLQRNYNALDGLYCALDANEFNKTFSFETTKKKKMGCPGNYL